MGWSHNVKTALILGITGQDGAYLAQLLLEKGYRVVGTSRNAGEIDRGYNLTRLDIQDKVRLFTMNPMDFRSVLDIMTKVCPAEVYNLTGQSSVGLSFEQPMDTFVSIAVANLTLLEVLRYLKGNVRYYNAGSSEIFGNTEQPADERTPLHPRSPYAVAKAAAFWQTVSYREIYNLWCCSGILFNHESPLRPERFVTQKIVRTACRIAQGSREMLQLGNMNIERDWGWAPDYVDAMWRMLQLEQPEDFVIATGASCQLRTFVQYVFEALALDWQKYVISSEAFFRPSDIMHSRANPQYAHAVLGWQAKKQVRAVAQALVKHEQQRLYGICNDANSIR